MLVVGCIHGAKGGIGYSWPRGENVNYTGNEGEVVVEGHSAAVVNACCDHRDEERKQDCSEPETHIQKMHHLLAKNRANLRIAWVRRKTVVV